MNEQTSDEDMERLIDASLAREKIIFELYTDFISRNQNAYCWEYSLAILDEAGESLNKPLLKSLRALSESKAKRLRDARFTICLGDNAFSHYFIAITRPTLNLTRFLDRLLTQVNGYETSEFASLRDVPAVPRFRYEAGWVIEYAESELAGTLLKAYGGRCAISRCDAPEALEAAHIIGYRGSNTNHISNGLLLRSDLHTLFDLHLLAIDTQTMTVLLAPALVQTVYREYQGRPLYLPSDPAYLPNIDALEHHRGQTGL